MSWIKEANKLGEYQSTYKGFRIYITEKGIVNDTMEDRADGTYNVITITPSKLIAINKNGVKIEGSLEVIGMKIDLEMY